MLPWLSLAWHNPILLQCLGLCYDMCEEDIHIGIVSLRGHFPAFNIKCQWSTIIFSEPIGFSAPKFSSESKNLGDFSIEHLSSYNLNCPAQSSPAPSFRLVIYEDIWLLNDNKYISSWVFTSQWYINKILDFRAYWDLCSKILHKLRHTWLIQVSSGISI